jgi:protoporphyrinogen oxidase
MKIGIIGAGISGLSAAYHLAKNGHTVTIFERSMVPGGLGTYIPVGGNYIERFYHHFFESDTYITYIVKELDIEHKLRYYKAKTGNYVDRKIYPFSSPIDLLTFSPISFVDRIKCGMSTAFLKYFPIPIKKYDTVSAKEWLLQYGGKKTYEKLWGPILEGKFSQYAAKIPLLWLQMRLYDRSFKLGYFDGSVKTLFDALIDKIVEKNGTITLGAEITGVEEKSGVCFIYEKEKKHIFDKVIITTTSPIAEKLIKNKLPDTYRSLLSSIDHLGAICVILELKYSVQSQYWLNICERNVPVLVMIEHTNLIDKKHYNGRVIVYLANYIHRNNETYKLSDKEVIAEYTKMLQIINKNFNKSWIINAYVSRVPRTQTIFQIGAYKKIPKIKTPLKNVYLINIDQMYPHDRNLNQGVKLGKLVSEMINGENIM